MGIEDVIPKLRTRVSELEPPLLGLHGALSSFSETTSPSRSVMCSSHFTQHLVIDGLEEKLVLTGHEADLAKYTFGVRMPANGTILRIIDKYPLGNSANHLPLNPETIVIYQDEDRGEVECFSLTSHKTYHQYFGWKTKPAAGYSKLYPGSHIAKGTPLIETPGVSDNGEYMYGLNANVAFMSVPGVSEDGFVISKSFQKKLTYSLLETRTASWGSTHYPLSIYPNNRQFPDIGDWIREDGLLMAHREHDFSNYVIDLSINDIGRVDYNFDNRIFSKPGRGRVIDLELISNFTEVRNTPVGMTEQSDKYVQAYRSFCQDIVSAEARIRLDHYKRFSKHQLKLGPNFHSLVVRCMAVINYQKEKIDQTLKLIRRKEFIDEYYAKFVIEYKITPDKGDKLSNHSGSKGVICKILEDHEMPVRPDGLRADVIADGGPMAHRMSFGQGYEHAITCTMLDVVIRLTFKLGLIPTPEYRHLDSRPRLTLKYLQHLDPTVVDWCVEYLITFYMICNTKMGKHFLYKLTKEEKQDHLINVVNNGKCPIKISTDNDRSFDNVILDLDAFFKPTDTPVEYVNHAGQLVTTKKNIQIGKIYMMLLDKIASEWSAVASAKLQHFGILSSITRFEKFQDPYRRSPTRISGETETRIFACYTGRKTIAEMFDRTSNPVTRKAIYWNLLNAEQPGRILEVVDRHHIPLGASKPIQLVNMVFNCAGIKPVYKPEIRYVY